MSYRLLAFDYDRTLTGGPAVGLHPDVPAALDRARARGLRVVVCSGQPLAGLAALQPHADAIVAENGAVRWRRDAAAPDLAPWPARPRFLEALRGAGLRFAAFDVIVDLAAQDAAALAKVLAPEHGAEVARNVDRLNVQPTGVTKGTGLAAVRAALGVPREAVVAMGDGENDVPMFREAGLAIAVANATPEARAAAHLQLDLEDGEAVCALVAAVLDGRTAALPRRR